MHTRGMMYCLMCFYKNGVHHIVHAGVVIPVMVREVAACDFKTYAMASNETARSRTETELDLDNIPWD